MFIYGIMAKWYIMVMVTALVVVFWVLKGLVSTGLLQEAEKVVFAALSDTKSIARYCVPKITKFSSFWECLQHPPKYEATKEEKELQGAVTNLLEFDTYDLKKDPYAPTNKGN